MASPQWNHYAMQELEGVLRDRGLQCPHCGVVSQDMFKTDDNSAFQCPGCGQRFSPAEFFEAQRRPPKTGLSTLYRPVGSAELDLIRQAEYAAFPPRLDWQPIFYPVLTQDYADFIAREWNSKDPDHDFVGYVTRFQVRNEFLCNYEIQVAADRTMLEYWIPAEDLGEFNDNIVGVIQVVAEFRNGALAKPTG